MDSASPRGPDSPCLIHERRPLVSHSIWKDKLGPERDSHGCPPWHFCFTRRRAPVLPGPGVIIVIAKQDGKTQLRCCFLPGYTYCMRSCPHWHGIPDCAALLLTDYTGTYWTSWATDWLLSAQTATLHLMQTALLLRRLNSFRFTVGSVAKLMMQYYDKQTTFNA